MPEIDRPRIVDRLRLERFGRRIRQRDVAASAGLSQSALSAIENHWRDPSPDELDRIARAIGVDLRELVEAEP